jgi:hypothetical protein
MTEVDDAAACMQRTPKQMALTTHLGAAGGVRADNGAKGGGSKRAGPRYPIGNMKHS